MKRIFLIAALVCSALLVLEGCSPKATSGTVAMKRSNVTGTWVLANVSYEGVPQSAIKSFLGESSAQCFVGSSWKLTNSGNGTYDLPGGSDCTAKTQSIFWSVSTADETFQFKKIYEGEKAKNVTEGYRLILSNATKDNLVIKSPVDYGNGAAYVVLNFNKAVN